MASSYQGIATTPRHSHTSTAVPPGNTQSGQHADTQTPVTPDLPSRGRPLRANSPESCTAGSIALSPIDSAYFRPPATDIFNDYRRAGATKTPYRPPCLNTNLASPSQLANIRARRAHHGPILLQSPARAGHAARMRQIFEDAGRENKTPKPNRDTLYPQLPNVSRKASPPPDHKAPEECPTPHRFPMPRPESLCISSKSFRPVRYQLNAACTAASEVSSEAWSGDSGYFIAGSRTRSSSVAVPPGETISNWLLSVSPGGPVDATEVSEGRAGSLASSPEELPWDFLEGTLQSNTPRPQGRTSPPDPFVEDTHELKRHSLFRSTRVSVNYPNATHSNTVTIRSLAHNNPSSPKSAILDNDGGVELSPLSPNVCIERGPTRRHYAHRNSPLQSPIRERHPTQSRRTRFQNNIAAVGSLPLEPPSNRKNGLAPCKIGVGTRFQHARHNTGGGGLR